MSKIIIGIHGLGNKPPEKILKKWWKKSIQEGLKAIGHPRLFFKFELVYWAHFLHPAPLDPKEKNKKNPLYIEYPYVPTKNAVIKKPSKLRQKILDYLEKEVDKIFIIENHIINLPKISDLIIRHFFKDLDTYYRSTCLDEKNSERPAKDVIRDQLIQILKKHRRKQILLIGHSMGSIIAYDVLTKSAPNVAIDTFITIGSPLGVPAIMSKIASELKVGSQKERKLKTPENVQQNWYNFSDLRDKVALNYNLADDYEANANHIGVIDDIVYNNFEYLGHKNPHKSYGYLRTPALANVIHCFLNRDRTRAMIWLTEKVNGWLYHRFKHIGT